MVLGRNARSPTGASSAFICQQFKRSAAMAAAAAARAGGWHCSEAPARN